MGYNSLKTRNNCQSFLVKFEKNSNAWCFKIRVTVNVIPEFFTDLTQQMHIHGMECNQIIPGDKQFLSSHMHIWRQPSIADYKVCREIRS